MIIVAIYNTATGEILRCCMCAWADGLAQCGPGEAAIWIPQKVSTHDNRVDLETLQIVPSDPPA